MEVRDARPEDTAQLLELMIGLARYEDYYDDFAVTHDDVLRFGFGPDARFHAFVADHDGVLIGMAVTYLVPWTFTLRPKLVLKELFVTERARGLGAGRALIEAVVRFGKTRDADRLDWTVMTGNTNAERFYSALGGRPDRKWNNWSLDLSDR